MPGWSNNLSMLLPGTAYLFCWKFPLAIWSMKNELYEVDFYGNKAQEFLSFLWLRDKNVIINESNDLSVYAMSLRIGKVRK